MTDDPRLLVTNDDSIDSPGLKALARSLANQLDVIVAAPSTDMSGSGTGIGRFDVDTGVEMTPGGVCRCGFPQRIGSPRPTPRRWQKTAPQCRLLSRLRRCG